MGLNIVPEKWYALCAYAAAHPTCKLVLHQHQGCIVRVTASTEQELGENSPSTKYLDKAHPICAK